MEQNSPVKDSNNNLDELMKETFVNKIFSGWTTIQGMVFPADYSHFIELIGNLQVRDDDVWVCTFIKAGTTWTQEMVWLLANDLNYQGALEVDIAERFPFIELSTFSNRDVGPSNNNTSDKENTKSSYIQWVDNLPSPRFIKTHLPFQLLPRMLQEGKTKAKIICVTRNPKDTCISYYHHCELITGFTGNFEQFCTLFMGDKLMYCPYWGHIRSFCDQKEKFKDRILFLKFEEMKDDLPSVITKTSAFLGKPAPSPGEIEKLVTHLSFKKMKDNPAVNYNSYVKRRLKLTNRNHTGEFMRCGEKDQWRKYMSSEIIEKFDHWIADNLGKSDQLRTYISV